MKRALMIMLGVITVTFLHGSVSANVYTENWNDPGVGANGWGADGAAYSASGGVDDSGYFGGTRSNYYPWINYGAAPTDTPLTGNFNVKYGEDIQISVYAKVVGGGNLGGYAWDIHSRALGTTWHYNFSETVAPTDWEQFSLQINSDWTDIEAEAAGWTRSAGTDSWFDSMRDVTLVNFFAQGIVGSVPGSNQCGLDNFVIQSVPEPATIGLITLGGLMALVRRKKQA